MSKSKKASAILLVIAVFLSAFSIGAFAANNHDTGYSFTVGQGWQARTEYREKTNNTSVYVKSLSGPTITYFYVLAPNGSNQNSGKGIAPISPGQERRIFNHVYENGWSTCALASINNPYSGQSTGVWSPDSVGKAPHAN